MDDLSGADTISLGATPRSFRPLSNPSSATFEDHADFTNRFGQGIFSRSCLAERIGTLDARDELVCSCCRTTHQRRKFSAHQQRREPEQRRCIAAPDVVELCSHINLRLDQMLELLENKGVVACVDCDSTASAGKVLVELNRTYFLMEAAHGEPLDDLELAYAISRLPIEQICPHGQTTDLATRFPPDWIWLSSSHQYHQRMPGCLNEMHCYKCKPTGVSSKMNCDRCVFTNVFLTRKASESDPDVDLISFITSRSTDFARKPGTVSRAWSILCEEPGRYCFSKEGYFG